MAYVGTLDDMLFHEAVGYRQIDPVRVLTDTETLYDLASLTKVVATTTAVLMLREKGALELDKPATDYLAMTGFPAITVRHLLTHAGGVAPGRAFYRTHTSIDTMLVEYAAIGADGPPGLLWRYSDIGFMILGRIIEHVTGQTLDRFCEDAIFKPLHMTDTVFNPSETMRARCAPTERCTWRNRLVHGEVHDENASAAGGISGHAGLFSTASDLAVFCRAFMRGELVSEATLDEISAKGQVPSYPWQGLGWLVDPWESRTTGFLPSRHALGHTGWTGTSMWMDLRRGNFAVLLSNTCHPGRGGRDNRTLRSTFHRSVARELYPRKANTHAGLDRLLNERFHVLRNANRIALLTNHAVVDELGRHILDVFDLGAAHKLHILYGPEHGIRGNYEAGANVPSEEGNVPVVSLYGERKRPSRTELAEIDLFVVDLQDIGSRYYTYMATMRECMAACAEAKKPVLVLDRPNPLGGVVLEGPIAEFTDSPVCCAPIPIRHGMTMGELALFFLREEFSRQKLVVYVNVLDSWRRDLLFEECAYPWTPPSPNIPTPLTALLYVGTCLFEGTNLNEGRGTETPFHVFGAPWLDAESIIGAIDPALSPGCRLSACVYTPRAIPGRASNPRYRDQACRGIRLHVENPHNVRAFTTTVALLGAIRQRHPNEFQWTRFFDVLAGGPALRTWIENGTPTADILARIRPELDAFAAALPRRYV